MTIGNISSKISFLTNAGTNSYSNADRLININEWYNRVHTEILKAQDEWDFDDSNKTTYPVLTADLVANQREYNLPTSILRIKRMEVALDGTNWYRAEPFDVSETSRAIDDSTETEFNTSEPYYDIQSTILSFYPKPAVSVDEGIKIWIDRTVDEFTSAELTTGTKEPGFDRNFHHLIALGPAYDFCLAKGLPQTVSLKREIEEEFDKLRDFFSHKQQDRIVVLDSSIPDYKPRRL